MCDVEWRFRAPRRCLLVTFSLTTIVPGGRQYDIDSQLNNQSPVEALPEVQSSRIPAVALASLPAFS
jgi:hypothetical protein